MLPRVIGVLGTLVVVGMVVAGLYVLVTTTVTDSRALSAVTVVLFLVVLVALGVGYSLWREDTTTRYW